MPLKIEVNADYLITSDSMNVIVNRKHVVDPTKSPKWEEVKAKCEAEGKELPKLREEWRSTKWFTKIEHALDHIVDQRVRESDAESIGQLRIEMAALRREIDAILTN